MLEDVFGRCALGRFPSSRFGCVQRPSRNGALTRHLVVYDAAQAVLHDRWATVGLDEIVNLLFRDPNVSKYYLRGYRKVNSAMKKLAVALAMSSNIAEKAMTVIVADPRLVRSAGKLREVVDKQLAAVENVYSSTSRRIAALIDNKACTSYVFRFTHAQVAFMNESNFRTLNYLLGEEAPCSHLRWLVEVPLFAP